MAAKVKAKTPVRPGRNGGTLKSGGNPKRSGGRPSNAWKERQLAIAEIASGKALEIAENPEHPRWEFVYRTAAEHAHGKPSQPIDVTGKVTVVWDL